MSSTTTAPAIPCGAAGVRRAPTCRRTGSGVTPTTPKGFPAMAPAPYGRESQSMALFQHGRHGGVVLRRLVGVLRERPRRFRTRPGCSPPTTPTRSDNARASSCTSRLMSTKRLGTSSALSKSTRFRPGGGICSATLIAPSAGSTQMKTAFHRAIEMSPKEWLPQWLLAEYELRRREAPRRRCRCIGQSPVTILARRSSVR